jgi:hypothetical protein
MVGVDFTALTLAGIVAAGSSVTAIEICLGGFFVVALAALLVLRARRDRDMRIRKAASKGYFDPDAARFGAGGVTTDFARPVEDPTGQPLAPTFAAPGRAQASRRDKASWRDKKAGGTAPATSPRPVPSFPLDDQGVPRVVPAFDPVAAINSRPGNG